MQAAMTAATPPTSQQRSLYNLNSNHGICLLFSGMVLHVHVGSKLLTSSQKSAALLQWYLPAGCCSCNSCVVTAVAAPLNSHRNDHRQLLQQTACLALRNGRAQHANAEDSAICLNAQRTS